MVNDRKEYHKTYYENTKEKNREKIKTYYENNKEQIIKKIKNYHQTETGKKINRISNWKQTGIITDDYDFLYDWYNSITHCINCGIQLISGSGIQNKKHLDHDHKTGQPCMVVCGNCNINILK